MADLIHFTTRNYLKSLFAQVKSLRYPSVTNP